MTVTETPPEAATGSQESATTTSRAPVPTGGLAGVVGSGDHKVLGRLYIAFSLLFGLESVGMGLLVAVDRIDGELGNTILSKGTWNQVLTFQATATVFLFLVPLLVGVAFTVVPLQVGSDTIAFPRAAAASFWGWLLSSGTFAAAYAMNGGPGGGDSQGVGLWAAAYIMVLASLLLAAVCIVTTVFTLRAPGMTLERTPLFSWSMLVAGALWILTLPVLIGTLALIYVDHRYGQKSFGFNGPEMYTRISWAVRQPQVYAFAAPLLGLAADVVPVSARTRQPNRAILQGAIAAFAVLGFGAFLQYTIYPRATVQPVYMAMAILAVLPVLAVLGGLATTMRSGSPRLNSPLVFVVTAVLSLLLATLLGAIGSVEQFDLQTTLFEAGQTNVAVFAAVTAALGALFYWATKINGRPLPNGLGMLAAGALFVGTLLAGAGYVISGAFGEGQEVREGIEAFNIVAAAGYGLVLTGIVITIVAVLSGVSRRDDVPEDPWDGGQTLEWATASPPEAHSFAGLPVVTSPEPLLDAADAEEANAR